MLIYNNYNYYYLLVTTKIGHIKTWGKREFSVSLGSLCPPLLSLSLSLSSNNLHDDNLNMQQQFQYHL